MEASLQQNWEREKQTTASWLKYDELVSICDRCSKQHCTGCKIAKELIRYES